MTLILEIAAGIVLGLFAFLLFYHYWRKLLEWAFAALTVLGVIFIFIYFFSLSKTGPAWSINQDSIFFGVILLCSVGVAWQLVALAYESTRNEWEKWKSRKGRRQNSWERYKE
jgi:hypothetical protein